MPEARDIVTLRVEGTDWAGWTSATISIGLDQIAGAFRLGVTERWPGSGYRPIGKEDACALLIGTDVVITGHVDEVERELAKDTHAITVTGRDATAELIDCAATNEPGEWHDRDGAAIVADLCRPFGIGVRVAQGGSLGAPFKVFTLQKGETAFAAIKRLCAARGVLPFSDGAGGLVLGPGKPERVATALVEGVNVLAATARDTRLERWRDYTVLSQSGLWDDANANAGTKGTAHDPGLRRYRPRVRLADDLADGITASDQAAWDAKVARAKAGSCVVTVQGWRHEGGLWRPNTLVEARLPSVGVAGERLVAGVEYSIERRGGTVAKLSLVGPGAFDLLAEREDGGEGGIRW